MIWMKCIKSLDSVRWPQHSIRNFYVQAPSSHFYSLRFSINTKIVVLVNFRCFNSKLLKMVIVSNYSAQNLAGAFTVKIMTVETTSRIYSTRPDGYRSRARGPSKSDFFLHPLPVLHVNVSQTANVCVKFYKMS